MSKSWEKNPNKQNKQNIHNCLRKTFGFWLDFVSLECVCVCLCLFVSVSEIFFRDDWYIYQLYIKLALRQ